jgi:hypothetical protein
MIGLGTCKKFCVNGYEIDFYGLEKHIQKMDNAHTGLGGCP